MNPPLLRNRIRNGTLALLVIALVLGLMALPKVHELGGSIRDTLYRNYVSIEAAQHMHAALWKLQVALADGRGAAVLPASRDRFNYWIATEESDITETGEGALARDLDLGSRKLFASVAVGAARANDGQFAAIHAQLDRLIQINRDAMFRADSRATRMSNRLTYEFALGLFALLLLGSTLSWTLAWNISRPLAELADRLRSFSLRGPFLRLGPQPIAELQAVAAEFNRMAERLEEFEKLNVDRLLYEKNKTEAIIESIEDGIVLIDSNAVVTHINEVAAIILGVERQEALGSAFDDLNSSHPHYLRVRSAVNASASRDRDARRIEVDLHVRGRDHTYVLKLLPLQGDGRPLGTILILQDITYLRDKDRARTNLVATLSHELKTPLTSLALSAEMLEREKAAFAPKQQELLATINEDVSRIRRLASDLLDLARGEIGMIRIDTVAVDLARLVKAVVKTFSVQAEQKQVTLGCRIAEPLPEIMGDLIKLSWVISNLIANAIRYTPAGGAIEISAEQSTGAIRLRVKDSGPGVPAPIREHLFERFAQSDVNGSEPGAAGLGLTIVKEMVEAHRGRIFVDSTAGEGTCFTVELPIDRRTDGQNPHR
ncbi:MAG: PAS domain-containing protein [Candidatus Binataceae bacterium]|nr:PAS domain-containing protein [Candidatus Binataceae bacterium]